jgi:hypothetical protein
MTSIDMNARYAEAKVCECRALIEEIDSGDGYRYWAHVKRMRIAYDHAAVPVRPDSADGEAQATIARLAGKVNKMYALADRYAALRTSLRTRSAADTIRTLLAD